MEFSEAKHIEDLIQCVMDRIKYLEDNEVPDEYKDKTLNFYNKMISYIDNYINNINNE